MSAENITIDLVKKECMTYGSGLRGKKVDNVTIHYTGE